MNAKSRPFGNTRSGEAVELYTLTNAKGAEATIAELGLAQVSDDAAIAAACDKVLAAEPSKVGEYRSGRDKLFGFFVGQVMKEMGGRANPKVVNDVLKRKLVKVCEANFFDFKSMAQPTRSALKSARESEQLAHLLGKSSAWQARFKCR